MSPLPDLAPILARRSEFRDFLASRLGGNFADAEDLLQNSLAKSLHAAKTIDDQEKLVAWFYRVLRNAAVDHIRSRQAAVKREETWWHETRAGQDEAGRREVCHCFESLLPTLKPLHGELLRRVEMRNESVSDAARSLGLTASHASVILHRARKELRQRLESFCGSCADNSCFDCDCGAA